MNTEYTIRFRCHPVLKWPHIEKKLQITDLPKNVFISENELKYDLENSDMCVYCGSSVSIEAICYGLPVVYYQVDKYFSYDPLINLNNFKWNINRKTELNDIISSINSMNHKVYVDNYNAANKYINKYFNYVSEDKYVLFN